MDEDEYKRLSDEFYRILYDLIKQNESIQAAMHFTIWEHEEDYIKIWEECGVNRKVICNIHETTAEECFRRGIYELNYYKKQKEEKEKQIGNCETSSKS